MFECECVVLTYFSAKIVIVPNSIETRSKNPDISSQKKFSFKVRKTLVFLLRRVSSDYSVEKWEKNSEEMKNSIFILLYLFLPDVMLDQSETTTPTTTSESSCRRNMKVMLQSIFQEYESNSAICVRLRLFDKKRLLQYSLF